MFCIWINEIQFAARWSRHVRTYIHIHTIDRNRMEYLRVLLTKVRARVYKINLLSDAIKYLSTGFCEARCERSGVHHSLSSVLRFLAIETLFLQALSPRSFFSLETRAPSGRVCFARWFATLEWCMIGYWENVQIENQYPSNLMRYESVRCSAQVGTVSETFETEKELRLLTSSPRKESLRSSASSRLIFLGN